MSPTMSSPTAVTGSERWLLDPERRRAELYRLGEDGLYRAMDVDDDGVFHSAVLPGLGLKPDWLWQQPPPSLMTVLREWELV